jgi:phosphate transport system substrate-binding protein
VGVKTNRARRARPAFAAAVIASSVGMLAGCGGGEGGRNIEGSGSTFAQGAFETWCSQTDDCAYRAVGSSGGIRELIDQEVDFAGSDVAMSTAEQEQLAAEGGDVAPAGSAAIQVPALVGAVSVPTNISGVDYETQRPRLTGSTLARIFAGEVTSWSDGEIAADNPGLALPDAEIILCVRGEGSGTTAVFTSYLTQVYPEFGGLVGASALPDWPGEATVVEAEGNVGVGECVRDEENAIGYVDLSDAVAIFSGDATSTDVNQIAEIGAEDGDQVEFVAPSLESIEAAGTVSVLPNEPLTTFQRRLVGADVPGAYPIAATTFILIHDRYASRETCDTVVDTVRFALSDEGQASLAETLYAPVGPSIRERGLAEVDGVVDADGEGCGSDDGGSAG